MEWGAIVLAVQILLLVAGWVLFQQAKTELTARAAQVPVLTEIKALQKSIAALLEQLKLESTQTSAQLEARCLEARELLAALDRRLQEIAASSAGRSACAPETTAVVSSSPSPSPAPPPAANPVLTARYQEVYSLADAGQDNAVIAQSTGFSVGEVELILGLRSRVS
jgi:DNA-binding NarL/FixJ family response regulator